MEQQHTIGVNRTMYTWAHSCVRFPLAIYKMHLYQQAGSDMSIELQRLPFWLKDFQRGFCLRFLKGANGV